MCWLFSDYFFVYKMSQKSENGCHKSAESKVTSSNIQQPKNPKDGQFTVKSNREKQKISHTAAKTWAVNSLMFLVEKFDWSWHNYWKIQPLFSNNCLIFQYKDQLFKL